MLGRATSGIDDRVVEEIAAEDYDPVTGRLWRRWAARRTASRIAPVAAPAGPAGYRRESWPARFLRRIANIVTLVPATMLVGGVFYAATALWGVWPGWFIAVAVTATVMGLAES
jgi:hypothetical protein